MLRATPFIALMLAGCAGAPERETAPDHQAIADCAASMAMREGESLGNGFRDSAALAHCQKRLAVGSDND